MAALPASVPVRWIRKAKPSSSLISDQLDHSIATLRGSTVCTARSARIEYSSLSSRAVAAHPIYAFRNRCAYVHKRAQEAVSLRWRFVAMADGPPALRIGGRSHMIPDCRAGVVTHARREKSGRREPLSPEKSRGKRRRQASSIDSHSALAITHRRNTFRLFKRQSQVLSLLLTLLLPPPPSYTSFKES